MNIIIVMAGGFVGAILRYLAGTLFTAGNGFPLGTFLVNLVGCFALGWLLTFLIKRKDIRPEISLLFGTGFLGSFTTFSTFSVETLGLFQQGLPMLAIVYVLASIFLGLLSSFLGFKLASKNAGKVGESA